MARKDINQIAFDVAQQATGEVVMMADTNG
jgi:hypothetical protein